ncbi:spore coat protein YlbD [Bacillus sp. FJAT-52991]|uniref:Spore coat protein YlbD n=1 Tax=Bacillus kandeliae TaxID=3129297 RepID=A0ABZ2N914_9BACI
MKTNSLHPEIQRFKKYVSERPELKKMVRKRETTLQQLFEEWYEAGEVVYEEKQERETAEFSSWIEKALDRMASLDTNKWNSYVAECQSVLETIQLMLADFVDHRKDDKAPFSQSERSDLD